MNKYSTMQKNYYEQVASKWAIDNRNPVVGSFDDHNKWKDYQYLFDGMSTRNKIALDFGCGPGRAMVLYWNRFERIDGADIAQANLDKAIIWFKHNDIDDIPNLFLTNGVRLNGIPDNAYDVVFSTITLQHICVHDIRYTIMDDIYRVLKPEGWFTAQMGFGPGHESSVGYFENVYHAASTNGGMDTRLENVDDLKKELMEIGFSDFSYVISKCGPGDKHSAWIYFRCKK